MVRLRLLILILLAVALTVVRATDARADDAVPHIEGHVTDPTHKLSRQEKRSIEELLGSIQSDSKIDVAAFIADVPPDQLEKAGRAAFRTWGIGRAWENGVLIVISTDARGVEIIVAPERPALQEPDIKTVTREILPALESRGFAAALQVGAERIGEVVRPRAKIPVARPPGIRRPSMSLRYAVGVFTVLVVAVTATLLRRRKGVPPEAA